MKIKVVYDTPTGQTWVVRLLTQGERYGLDEQLTHEGDEPLVEFYDARYPHTDLGQYVARYALSTMLEHRGECLALDLGIPSWRLTHTAMAQVYDWLLAQSAKPQART